MIIAISGTPGTGKTSVSRELGKILEWKVIGLNEFAKKSGCISGYDKRRECDVVDTMRLRAELKKIKEKNLIIESHYAHDMDADVYVILKTRADVLRKRAAKKGWKKEKTEENVLAEIMDVCLSEAMEKGRRVYEIDTTGKKPTDVAKEIVSVVGMNKYI